MSMYLGPKAQRIYEHLLTGKSTYDIARIESLSTASVWKYSTQIYKKFGVNTRIELMAKHIENYETRDTQSKGT